jgi:hypothetical protein
MGARDAQIEPSKEYKRPRLCMFSCAESAGSDVSHLDT